MARFCATAAALAVAVVAGLTAGCGGSKSSASRTSSGAKVAPRATATSSSGSTVTKPQATAYARAVNLKAGDVPQLTASGVEREAQPKKPGEEAARCAGAESRSRHVVDLHSPKFSGASAGPREQVSSDVVVWPSPATAERNASAEFGPRGRECTKHLLERLALRTAASRVRIAGTSVAWLSPPRRCAKDPYAARVTLTIAAEGARGPSGPSSAVLETPSAGVRRVEVPLYLDVLGFLSGPAQVSLTAMSIKRPPPPATERRLLSLLCARALAQKL